MNTIPLLITCFITAFIALIFYVIGYENGYFDCEIRKKNREK
jgi:hypothetical protein